MDLKTRIKQLMDKNVVSGKLLLDRMRVIDENSRRTAAYADPNYTPFYYVLGKILTPENMMEIGFSLGLLSSCFLKSCKTVKKYFGFQEKKEGVFYSPSLGISNLKDNYKGHADFYVGYTTDDEFAQKLSQNSWDLVIINEEVGFDKHLLYLDLIWPHLKDEGIIVSENITRHTSAKEAFEAFCTSKNRGQICFDTRYGTGLVIK